MLQHHTLKSTKYMVKWIESKNKIKPAFFQTQLFHDKFEVKHLHWF